MPLRRPRVVSTFSAHKGTTAQTGILASTFTKLTFPTEDFDIGGHYDATNSIWTPPAGIVRVTCSILISAGLTAGSSVSTLTIYKNGVRHGPDANASAGHTSDGVFVSGLVEVDGNDTIEMYLFSTGTGDKMVSGAVTVTKFQGELL